MNGLDAFLNAIDDVVWGIPTIVLILATGLLMTIACRGIQFTKSKLAFKSIFKKNEENGYGELTGFAALCTALSATIGTGNIVGVATAIAAGGPGARRGGDDYGSRLSADGASRRGCGGIH